MDVLNFLYRKNKRVVKKAEINGYNILVDLKDGIGKQIYGLRRYEKKYTDVLKKVIKKNWVCVDVGANIGYYSLLMAKLAPEGKVYAIEPNKELCELIEKSRQLNDFDIEIVNKAVGSEKGIKRFYISNDSGFSSLNSIDNVEKEVEVEVIRLDDLIVNRADLIKIDTEGTAKDVLRGMSKILNIIRPKVIQIEIRLDDEIIEVLNGFNYHGYYIKKKGELEKVQNNYPNNVDYYFVSQEYEEEFLSAVK